MEVVIILISVLFSAFFSGMEIAFITANKLRLEVDRKKGNFPSGIINIFTKNQSQYIATMLVGNNVALVVYGIFMAILLEPVIIGFGVSPGGWLLFIQTMISTLLILFTAEFLPKTLFRINPNFILSVFALPVMLFYILLYPIAKFSIWLSNNVLRGILKVDLTENSPDPVFGKLDLDNLVSEIHDDGEQKEQVDTEIRIFQNALEFSDVKLRDCMIPRTEIVALEINDTIENLKEKFIESGLSRILIYKETIDHIIGFINSSELFKNPKTIKSKLVQLPIVPESMAANRMLEVFMKEHKNIAVVVDEFGGTSGMVTIEDIIEEIFGEIEDEHDNVQLDERVISENEFVFSGRLEIDYINEKYKLNIPETEDYNTIAGYIFSNHQSVPEQNQIVRIHSFIIKILKVSQTKIELVNLKRK
jgi:CBS domain containing-hemolysin-like protein